MMPSAAEMSGAASAVVSRALFTKALTSLMTIPASRLYRHESEPAEPGSSAVLQ